MSISILFDIGGTHMRAASSADGKTIGKVIIEDTPKNFEEGILLIEKLAKDVAGGEQIKEISMAIAGEMDQDRQKLFWSPNLSGWVDEPLLEKLNKLFNVPVHIRNDAAMAGLGEALYGAGKGFNNVMYFTISTGVGGANIVGGAISENTFGFEPGQQIIDFKNNLSLESLVSGNAFERRFGKKPMVTKQEDFIWKELASYLASGLYNSALHWSPDVIVLGGPMVLATPGISIDEVEQRFAKLLTEFSKKPLIKKATLGYESALYGALKIIN